MDSRFSEVITSEADLRALVGYPSERAAGKVMPQLDEHTRAFIAKSPFLLIASADGQGGLDISPKGDPAGFVHILDDTTLAIPDRPGNRRADTFGNLLQNPKIGLLFLMPGKQETLRVSGEAQLVRDSWLREQMTLNGNTPQLAVVVHIHEVFFHCPKCMIRSGLWEPGQWPDVADVPSLGLALHRQVKFPGTPEELQAAIDKDVRERLY
jgi:uncharacterized protein